MELKIFKFIESVVKLLEENKIEYVTAANKIEDYFEESVCQSLDGYLNINCRVKTSTSLREKLIRNKFYRDFNEPEIALKALSDLIGVRIECRFTEDENKIYKKIEDFFSLTDGSGYYYNEKTPNILLKLDEQQPQKQKNGFEIYKIDGFYTTETEKIRFELQIKCLVNMFWGEIEHKVIYKNNNYMLMDKLFKDMMVSIKKNLTMIDNQLLIIYDQFNSTNAVSPEERKFQVENLMSKIIYDIFARRMREQIGFLVDFRKSCDTIMRYIFRSNNAEEIEDYSMILVKTMSRLNDISSNDMDFTSHILFSRPLKFNDSFEERIGKCILGNINEDFQWNLFFRVLFEIERGNNAEDFETFIEFIKKRFYEIPTLNKLFYYFEPATARDMITVIITQIAEAFTIVNSIEFIYDDNIHDLSVCIGAIVNKLSSRVEDTETWENNKSGYSQQILKEILKIYE